MVTKATLASNVQNRTDDIPSAITSTVIQEYIEDSHIEVENYTGDTFATTDIPTRYQPILIDMATVKVLDYMITHNIMAGGTITVSASDLRAKKDALQKRVDSAMINLLRTEGFSTTTEPEEMEDA